MTDHPRPVPPPPTYPPSIGHTWTPPEPTVIILPAPLAQEQPRRRILPDVRWRPTAALFAISPGLWWAHTLADPSLPTSGGYAIAGVVVIVTGALDHARGWWITRAALYAALIGPALALPGRPLLDLVLYLTTGATS